MANLNPEYSWYPRAAKRVVREGKSLLLVLDILGINGIPPQDVDRIYHSESFQQCLRTERLRYANEIAADPLLSKNSAIGMMILAIERLMAEGEWDKALEGLQKLSRLTGWQGADSNVNLFADLTGKDFEEIKREIAKKDPERVTLKTRGSA